MNIRERILCHLRDRQTEIIELCQALIRIPSEDPPGDNRPICSFIRDYLRERGVGTEVHGLQEKRPNIVGRVAFSGPGPNVVFNGHMETLPVGDRARWTYDPYAATIVDGRLYGRGTWCMKGGIAAEIYATLALREHAEALTGSVTLAFVSDEVNGGSLGTGYLVDNVADVRGDVALVGEGAPAILIGHKGPVFVEFRATGDAMPSAYIFGGVSAIHRLMDALHEIRQLNGVPGVAPMNVSGIIEASREFLDAEFGPGATDALMQITVSIGTIQGGRRVNVVADDCMAQVDFRLPPGLAVEALFAKIRDILERHPGVSFRSLWANEPAYSSPDHPWLQILQRDSQEIFGEMLRFRVSHGFTDARFFHLKGIPAAAIGRRGGVAGAPDEYIEVEDLLKSAELFALGTYDYLTMPE